MKAFKINFKPTLATLLLAAAFSTANAAGSLVFAPANSSVLTGTSFSVEVRGSGFTDQVVGGGFSLSFNPSALSLNNVTVNTVEWEFLTSPGTIDNAAGSLSDVWFNAFAAPLPTGNFPIAVLTFTAKLPISSVLILEAADNFPFANDLAQVINVNFGSSTINVSAVPELSSWATMALGLALGLGLLPLWRRRTAPRL